MNPQYPIYIISKGRWESRLTSKALEKMHVPYRIVIEPQEFDNYSAVISPEKILTLPFSNMGQGSIPARNWIWEHSISEGYQRHWILDDNIAWFARIYQRKKIRVDNGVCFRVTEDFVDRYENVMMAGLQYEMFTPISTKFYPFILNTRCYSCILLSNSISHRWRGKYNEDTDLSIRILEDGYCTILIQAFVCKKMATLTMKGGNTDILYQQNKDFDGRYEMARSLQIQHPHIVKITRKWGRWQHSVNYKCFKKNKLRKKPNIDIPSRTFEYGMRLTSNPV